MIIIYTRSGCAYCPMVKKYLGYRKVKYQELPAKGDVYLDLSTLHGFTVPLVTNGDLVMVGYNITKLKEIADAEQS